LHKLGWDSVLSVRTSGIVGAVGANGLFHPKGANLKEMGLDGDGIIQQNLTESMIFCWGSYCLNGISMIFFAIQQNLTASFHEAMNKVCKICKICDVPGNMTTLP